MKLMAMIACKIAHNIAFVNTRFQCTTAGTTGHFSAAEMENIPDGRGFGLKGRHQTAGCRNAHAHGFFLFR